jgi:glycosyltransferase involved in cell wall biosynthesis
MNDKNCKIVFSGHDFKFLTPLIERCEKNAAYEVKMDQHRNHEILSEEFCQECLEWADVVFCEWAMGNAVWYSRHKRPGQKLIVRLHSQEIEAKLKYLWDTDWRKVDCLILICHHTYDKMLQAFPELEGRCRIIYNPIDVQDALNVKKYPDSDFNLGFVGVVPRRKRLDLAFDLLTRLKEVDSRYRLSIKGRKPEEFPWMFNRPDEMKWYDDLFQRMDTSFCRNSVVFEPFGKDMASWYDKIGFIVSTSDFEGSHQAVAEGMAAGAIPIIRNWEGADRIYPAKYVFSSLEEAVEKVLHWKSSPEIYQAEADFCRKYALEKFDQEAVCDQMEELFAPEVVRNEIANNRNPAVMMIAYIPLGSRDGYRIRIEQEIAQLNGQGVNVTLVCLHSPYDQAERSALLRELEPMGCRIELVECERFFEIGLTEEVICDTLAELKKIIKLHSIKIIHAEALYCAKVGLLLKKLVPECKLFYDCHGASSAEEAMSGASVNRIKASEIWNENIIRNADLNIFVSEAMRDYYISKYDLDNMPSIIIPCCISRDKLADSYIDSPLKLPDNCPVVGYIGTLAPWQCADEMFMLFGKLHAAGRKLHFCIIAPESDHGRVRQLFKRNGIPKSDFTVAQLEHAQVGSALSRFSGGLLLRRDDTVNRVSSPTKYAEYLAAGVPVIMTGYIGDYSRDTKKYRLGWIVDLPDAEREAFPDEQIAMLLNRLEYHFKVGKKDFRKYCHRYLEEHLDWMSHIELLIRKYKSN